MGSNPEGRGLDLGGEPMSEGEDVFDDEEEVMDNATHCPVCDDMTGHAILKERKVGDGADFKVRCDDCGMCTRSSFGPHPP